jgi:ABC-2 type transport system ATP-binding protein
MSDQKYFVDVQKAFVDYELNNSFLKMLGGSKQTKSALRDVTFQIPQGAHITIFGHSAAGKSTLLRLLTGVIRPSSGHVRVNGRAPQYTKHIAAGYVSAEESEPTKETCHKILSAFARTHDINKASARISKVGDVLKLNSVLFYRADQLSTSQKIRLNIARAALSDSPLVLLDDTADQLGARTMRTILKTLFHGRTVIHTTRFASTAEKMKLPLLLLHKGTIAHHGTVDQIAADLSCPRIVDVWIEGLRYDLLRKLRQHPGVAEARLIPSSRFSGQLLRVTLRSSRYMPAMYDLVSQAPLIKVTELPPSFNDIISRL